MIKKSNSVAIYLRLSEEDYDVTNGRDGLLKEESDSIANQRKLIDNYLKKRNEFNRCQFNEYCDDGFSGTNFERPDFQKMLRDAETGKIDTIVFKDYSRLGRNFLGVGKYLEEILPELEIRVISINDGYDSNNILETSEGISIPMKNLINDYYVKDLSKKVKSAIKSRQTRGQFISACAIFGYKKDPRDKHQLIIDEETASIVKMIFKYALDGMNGTHIAKKLNELEILTPAWYSGQSKKRTYEIDQKSIWTSAKVMKIIRDQRYTGDMVGNVRVHTKIAKAENRRVDRKDWIIIEDTHEGIISKEIFYKVNQEVMPLKEREEVLLGDARRKGFCYCAECGRLLQRTNTIGMERCV